MANTYKILGQVRPSDTNNANLYTVPSLTSAIVSTLHIANVTSGAATARIFVRNNGAAASEANAVAYDVEIAGNSLFAMTTGLTLAAGDIITVRSSTGNALAFHLFGSEVN